MDSATLSNSAPFLGLDPREAGLSEPLTSDILLLDRLLADVLREQESGDLTDLAHRLIDASRHGDETDAPAHLLETVPELADPESVQKLLRAFTVLFQLLNTAEQKEIVRVNRARQEKHGGAPRTESIGDAVRRLAEGGVSAHQMQSLLDRIDICPTLTAHPTEARRRAVLDKLQTVAECLAERNLPLSAPLLDRSLSAGEEAAEQATERALTELWQTDELRASPITVPEEARNAMYFFERSIFDVVAWMHDDLRAALAASYPGHEFVIGPFVTYRSWVGGDRDGNPNVTPDVTWRTLLEHRRLALQFFIKRVDKMRRELTLSVRNVASGDPLLVSLLHDRETVPLARDRQERYKAEPYALKFLFIHERLLATLRHTQTPDGEGNAHAYSASSEFIADLRVLQQSLHDNKAERLANGGGFAALLTQAQTFGFHLAALDIRQHSDEHALALNDIFQIAGVLPNDGPLYADLPEAEKIALLTRELQNPRPLISRDAPLGEAAQKVLRVFDVVRRARRNLSQKSVEAYIISMTHAVSDMLEPMLLAKEAGLLRWEGSEMVSELDIVPLFETIDDLQNCDTLIRELFASPIYLKQLAARKNFQEIMLGYSDSSKDGGFLAANWALHDTQTRLARVCREANVELRFFHGRGGTVGRGGGRANRAIQSQPPHTFSGRIRFTEQGEVISFRYSLPPIAHRHLEQIVSASLLAVHADEQAGDQNAEPELWLKSLAGMAHESREVYRKMVHDDPDFWVFFAQATPIKHISRLPIASRPVSRSGKKLSSVDDLRAIPWVFAWIQSRYVVPGWFGLGSALEWFAGEAPENAALLQTMYQNFRFFKAVIDNAQLELIRAHLPTAARYAARVDPPELGERFHNHIAGELRKTREWVLRITNQDELLGHAPVVRATVHLRNPAVIPLSLLQVALMEAEEKAVGPDADLSKSPWREAILLSITGVAAAMQSTG